MVKDEYYCFTTNSVPEDSVHKTFSTPNDKIFQAVALKLYLKCRSLLLVRTRHCCISITPQWFCSVTLKVKREITQPVKKTIFKCSVSHVRH